MGAGGDGAAEPPPVPLPRGAQPRHRARGSPGPSRLRGAESSQNLRPAPAGPPRGPGPCVRGPRVVLRSGARSPPSLRSSRSSPSLPPCLLLPSILPFLSLLPIPLSVPAAPLRPSRSPPSLSLPSIPLRIPASPVPEAAGPGRALTAATGAAAGRISAMLPRSGREERGARAAPRGRRERGFPCPGHRRCPGPQTRGIGRGKAPRNKFPSPGQLKWRIWWLVPESGAVLALPCSDRKSCLPRARPQRRHPLPAHPWVLGAAPGPGWEP